MLGLIPMTCLKWAFFACFVCSSLGLQTLSQSCDPSDLLALKEFAGNLTNGSIITSWSNNNSVCCQWDGVVCGIEGNNDSVASRVSMLILPNKGLKGIISRSLGLLDKLKLLDLSCNHFEGVLPFDLSNLKQLQVLDLSHNLLSGQVSRVLSVAVHLIFFFNQLTVAVHLRSNFKATVWLGFLGGSRSRLSERIHFSVPLLAQIHLLSAIFTVTWRNPSKLSRWLVSSTTPINGSVAPLPSFKSEVGINGVCDDRVIRIDVGMSKECINGLPEVLEINGNSGLRILTSNPLYQNKSKAYLDADNKEELAYMFPQYAPKQVEVKA
ncbi:hypothetical protein QYF36_013272 [Acer negundo]|nr:hypothetical protein QYF36_013272 [Acer negundo]